MKKVFFLAAGSVFLILGLIGLVLPVIPQVPFFILAVILLSKGSDRINTWVSNSSLYKKIYAKLFPKKLEGTADLPAKYPAENHTAETTKDTRENNS